jgi:competence protein ComEC
VIDTTGGTCLTRNLIAPVRSSILRCIDVTIGGEEGEFLKGLLIGERGGMSQDTMQAFVTAGVAHVLAVSGSNVAVVAVMLSFIAGLVRFPAMVRTALIAAGLLFYMELTGGQTPVVRATIMALTFLVGRAAQRRANAYNSLGLSAFLILLYDARQLYDAGFQLSFCAVFGIIHLYPRMNAWISGFHGGAWWHRAIVNVLRLSAVSLAATLATLPVTAAWFGRVSLIGVIANIPVVPATGLSVVLGAAAVAGSIAGGWAASALGALNSLILHATLAVTRIAAAVPYASLDASGFHPSVGLAFCAATGLIFHWREPGGVRVFIPALLLSLNVIVFLPPDPGPAPGLLRVHFIDVGQGDAILVEFPGGRTMLIDAGPWSPSFDAGERTVLPYLRRRGIDRVDLLVVTHPHSDHLGGVPFLLGHLKVGTLVDSGQPVRSALYASYLRASAGDGLLPEAVSAGRVLDAEPDARLYVLSPPARFVDRDTSHAPPNLNNTSVVLKLQYGHVALLLAGDAEENAEDAMVRHYGSFLRSALLKSGHHGSITSSSQEFLDAVRPSMVAVSVGRRNRFHHPSAVVLERFASCGALVARTDVDGAVIVETDGTTLTRVRWR